jgi:hypothetical protein
MTETFLAGSGELADRSVLDALRVGTRLGLRRSHNRGRAGGQYRIEVQAPGGRACGYLPPEDTALVGGMLDAGASVTARVRGVVPAFQRPRVQLTVEIVTETGDGS